MKKRWFSLLGICVILGTLAGCASKSTLAARGATNTNSVAVAATSVAVMEICEKLDIPLIGVPKTDLAEIPECYASAVEIGSPMSPDMEILGSLSLDWVLSPASLQSDLQPKYEAAGIPYVFLNLKSIPGMYQSIEELGELFHKEEQASQLVQEYEILYQTYQEKQKEQEGPTVLILMGVPGSYVVATENSYVGSLVALAGGQNVYAGTEEEFLSANTEDMLQKNPDIILRTAHALPEQVMEMFSEEFETNDIWKHFSAVQEGQVYDLSNGLFGMSANFEYTKALEELDLIFYGQEDSN